MPFLIKRSGRTCKKKNKWECGTKDPFANYGEVLLYAFTKTHFNVTYDDKTYQLRISNKDNNDNNANNPIPNNPIPSLFYVIVSPHDLATTKIDKVNEYPWVQIVHKPFFENLFGSKVVGLFKQK